MLPLVFLEFLVFLSLWIFWTCAIELNKFLFFFFLLAWTLSYKPWIYKHKNYVQINLNSNHENFKRLQWSWIKKRKKINEMFFHHYHQVLWVVKWGTLRTDCQSDTINYMYFFKTEISLKPVGGFFSLKRFYMKIHSRTMRFNVIDRELLYVYKSNKERYSQSVKLTMLLKKHFSVTDN